MDTITETTRGGRGRPRRLRRILASSAIAVSAFAALATPAAAATTDGYTALTPQRVLDTRLETSLTEGEKVAGKGTLDLTLAGVGDVPLAADVDSVALNLTVTGPESAGYITVFPTAVAAEPPIASSLNFATGQTIANAVIAKLGDGGQVTLFNGGKEPVHIIADVVGYFATDQGAGQDFSGLAATRMLDTRTTQGGDGPVNGKNEIELDVTTGEPGEPPAGPDNSVVKAVVLNVTVTNTFNPGHLTVWPGGAEGDPPPTTSVLNFDAGQTVATLVVATVGTDGDVHIYNGSVGRTDIIADVVGWFSTATEANDYVAASPTRLLDTRLETSPTGGAKLASGEVFQLDLTGTDFAGQSAVVLTIVANQPTHAGHLTVWPDTGAEDPLTTMPTASSLNFPPGKTVSNLVISAIGDGNLINVRNTSKGAVHVIIDGAGSFPVPAA